ncbi:GNAT family N-acetyltransferase, partial [Rhizobiaceae bacterium]|nr:GNAT family N-acetyltransferase [Rhizobiaceae bacterium]
LVGGAALGNIRRSIAQTATLGYWIGAPFAGRHFMREAVQAIAAHAFADVTAGGLGLLRLEAATVPENEASQKVLAACGFAREGTARGYLEIGGQRRDHHLFARLSGDGC